MTSLNWQDSPEKSLGKASRSTASVQNGNASGPWFAISIGLIGLIVGFGFAQWRGGSFSVAMGTPPAQIAQVPTPPTVPTQQPPEPTSAQNLPPIDAKIDHIRGDLSTAKVAVVEYSDFECPFCIRHHPTMQQIVDTYGDDVAWIYRHFSLNFHENAQKEAEASECANELGGNDAFWQYADAIFERTAGNGTGFPLANLAPLAKELGLDEAKFTTCLDSGKYAKHVQDDMSGGSAAGVNGTPGNIVVNLKTDENRIISGAVPFASFKTIIDTFIGSDAQAAAPSADSGKVIKMTAELWKFTPNVVTVKKGENVTLEIRGVSGTHGIAIPDLGINETVIQGNTVSIKIPTDKTGVFNFACSIQCGEGHTAMTGQIIITE